MSQFKAISKQSAMLAVLALFAGALAGIAVSRIDLAGATVEGGETCTAVSPNYRAIDTRADKADPGPKGKVNGGKAVAVKVAGVNTIPADAKTVWVQLTAVNLTGPDESFLVAYPTPAGGDPNGTAKPPSSNLNPRTEHTTANGAIPVKVGANGSINVYNNAGATHVLVDVLQWCDTHNHDARYPRGYSVVESVSSETAWAAGEIRFFSVSCPTAMSPTGGGGSNSGSDVAIIDSRPNPIGTTPTGWGVWYENVSTTAIANIDISAHAICMDVPGQLGAASVTPADTDNGKD